MLYVRVKKVLVCHYIIYMYVYKPWFCKKVKQAEDGGVVL